ncbi:DMT family transporter [Flagellimonas meridianipacifica]|uniref:Drug/metabolite transporter (DMT)-like permease n=1 Tax=Flagellimonas meridianipacifica TaxID=1080225 RepID=A0A2T0MGC2_9FLAO|nr:EamA family transporter [Allomuricauda pacifica]PRX56604.1 drug/metabolite transporter (DMT)-like permease [Allomuricauda pacifica]
MTLQNRKWIYLFVLSVIWGTSYILIKKGLDGFNPVQLGAVRVVLAGLFLFIIGFKSLRTISKKEWPWVALSGFVGSFIPMFLFAFAQTEIDSAIASILNSLVPLFTLFIGFFAFGISFGHNQLVGVIVGLVGAICLVVFESQINPSQNYWYAGFVVLATICYASNANIIKSKLDDVSAMGIAVGNFSAIIVPALLILPFSGFFSQEVTTGKYFWSSLGYIVILCIMSTCVAKVMFNRLVQISSAVFSVSVTYLIPLVGIFWGILDGEEFKLQQLLAAAIILLGVYLVNKKKTPK